MHQLELIPLFKAAWETIYIVFISSSLSVIGGLGIGILLFLTKSRILNFIVNGARSIPFIILMISILPLTRLLAGTTIGTNAAIVPLTLAAIPFFARICESAFSEVPHGLIEAAYSFGATTNQLIHKVLIPESLPSLIRGITLTVISLIGYSAMAGAVGGGGLGELAINYGYQRFDVVVTIETVILLIILVQLVQLGGDMLAAKRRFKPIFILGAVLGLICLTSQVYPSLIHQEAQVRVGVTAGWPEEVMKVAQKVAKDQYHLNITIVPFNDYVLPNTALSNGNIDANIFQHVPYLNAQNKARGYHLVPIAKTFVYPMGIYSRKIQALSELKIGATIAIPNDPSNQARALLLLEKSGLISLKNGAGINASVRDIIANPKKLHFKQLDAAQLPRVMKDADLVALTNDFIGPAGLTLNQAIVKEGSDSFYVNVIVANEKDKNDPKLQELVSVMHSEQVLEATKKIFPNGAAIPSW
jgi:D-methionine transport system substrate-binding protein